MKIKIACGTNDKITFSDNHFGDSKYFLIYEYDLENNIFKFLKIIKNIFNIEHDHGDKIKAGNISDILKEVSVLVASEMGPNINRMRKKFIPIISREKDIEGTLRKIKNEMPKIIVENKKTINKDKKVFVIN